MAAPQHEMLPIQNAIDEMTLRAGRLAAEDKAALRPLGFARVVVATDGSDGAQHALAWGAVLARAFGSKVHVVSVVAPPSYTYDRGGGHVPAATSSPEVWDRLLIEERKEAQQVLDDATAWFAGRGVSVTTELAVGSPVERIAAAGEAQKADLVIVGSYGANAFERFLIGSTADGVKNQSEVSVLIAKDGPQVKHLLLPTDGSLPSRAAVLTGLSLAGALAAQAHVLHVVAAGGAPEQAQRVYEEAYRELHGKDLSPLGVEKGDVDLQIAYGPAHRTILERAEESKVGLIVMGSRGLSGLKSRLAGSVSNPVSHRASCSVLLLKEAEDERSA